MTGKQSKLLFNLSKQKVIIFEILGVLDDLLELKHSILMILGFYISHISDYKRVLRVLQI